MSELLLSVDKVTAGYAQDIDVLRDVSLDVHAGEISGLIGLNGAGKSTVVKTICGFLSPKAGGIRFMGQDIAGIAPHKLIDHGICCIPQESSLFPYLTVEENLLLPLQGRSGKYGSVGRRFVGRAAEAGGVCQGVAAAAKDVPDRRAKYRAVAKTGGRRVRLD
jgi:branched-chain amino acid transport system ATP-binding protein